MSDEQSQPPPSLRLKPRLKPPEGEAAPAAATPPAPPSPVADAPASAAPLAEGEKSAIRLKPRLTPSAPAAAAATTEAASAPAPAAPAPVAPPPPAPAAVAPAVAPTETPAAAPTAPRIQLKPKLAAPAATAPAAAPAPTSEAPAAPPPPPVAAASAAAPVAEPGKFKLKPKAPGAPPPPPGAAPAGGPPPPPPPPGAKTHTVPPIPLPPPPSAEAAAKAPPPFPVVAPPGGKPPPVPHIAVSGEVAEPAAAEAAPEKTPFWKKKIIQYIGSAALLIIVVAIKFGYGVLTQATSDTIRDKMKSKPEAKAPATGAKASASPVAKAPTPPAANKNAPPTPGLSDTQNAIAHAPVNAVNKAKDAITARQNSGQGRDGVGAITDADKPAVPDKSAQKSGGALSEVATSLAPGVSAPTTETQAGAEASVAFRSFIANAKITGAIGGPSPKVYLNRRLVRVGETIDSTLAITFEGYDDDKKLLSFKDKAGSVVTRRYP